VLSRFLFKACGVPNERINKTLVSAELLFKVLLKTPRSCSALAGTPADLATVTRLPHTASSVCWS
jgi:hypothetical protein